MYLIAQPIVARSLQIFPIGKFISISIIVWGILLTCTAACRSFASLMAVRALLGIVEACVNPAFMVLTAQWYKRDEQPERSGWWNLGLAGGQIFGGLIGYGVGHIKYRDYQPWMWFFIVFGCISTIWGVFLVYYLPDSPMDAKFLTVADRTIAVERVRENKTGIQNQLWKWYQFWECLRDPFTWFQFSIMVLGTVPSGGVSSFGSIVIKGFGFSSLNTTLLGMPLGLVQLISFVLAGRVTARWKNIRLHCSWSTCLSLPPQSFPSLTSVSPSSLPSPSPNRSDPPVQTPFIQQIWTTILVLHLRDSQHPLHLRHGHGLRQRRRFHQKDDSVGYHVHRLLCWSDRRPSGFP